MTLPTGFHHFPIFLIGRWVSPKLGGIRALWDGKRFYLRNGVSLLPPRSFINSLPPFSLDGQLIKEGDSTRESIVKIAIPTDTESRIDTWANVKYVVFDSPAIDLEYEQR